MISVFRTEIHTFSFSLYTNRQLGVTPKMNQASDFLVHLNRASHGPGVRLTGSQVDQASEFLVHTLRKMCYSEYMLQKILQRNTLRCRVSDQAPGKRI